MLAFTVMLMILSSIFFHDPVKHTKMRINSKEQSLIKTRQGKRGQGRHTGKPGVTSKPDPLTEQTGLIKTDNYR